MDRVCFWQVAPQTISESCSVSLLPGFLYSSIALPALSLPGRSPANVISFARFAAAFFACAFCPHAPPAIASAHTAKTGTLPLAQDRIQPRLEILFALAPQHAALHRQRRLDRLYPSH